MTRTFSTLAGIALVCCLTACAATPKPAPTQGGTPPPAAAGPAPSAAPSPTASDATAEHLHDLAGRLLLYYVSNRDALPARLEDLDKGAPAQAGDGTPAAIDPATGRPLIYAPNVLNERGPGFRVLVYQAEPTSAKGRWALLLRDGASLTEQLYVDRLPDSVLPVAR